MKYILIAATFAFSSMTFAGGPNIQGQLQAQAQIQGQKQGQKQSLNSKQHNYQKTNATAIGVNANKNANKNSNKNIGVNLSKNHNDSSAESKAYNHTKVKNHNDSEAQASTYTKVKNNVNNDSKSKSNAYAGGSESEAYSEGNDVNIEGDDYKFPANSVPTSIGGVCTDSAAAQGTGFGMSIGRANPVCEKLKMYEIYRAAGMDDKALAALKNAETLSDIRGFFRGTLTVLTLGIL